eukprot:6195571-Pleurochrysis_carterae.AAC.1
MHAERAPSHSRTVAERAYVLATAQSHMHSCEQSIDATHSLHSRALEVRNSARSHSTERGHAFLCQACPPSIQILSARDVWLEGELSSNETTTRWPARRTKRITAQDACAHECELRTLGTCIFWCGLRPECMK